MSDQTPVVDDTTPPSSETTQPPASGTTETVEELKTRLAAEEKARLEAEEDAKRWKNRVKEENPPKKKVEDTTEAYSDWRIDNKDRISVPGVKEAYEKELAELQEGGAKPTLLMREKALKLAESAVGVKKADPNEPLPSPAIDRGGQRKPTLTESDQKFGIKPETKEKWSSVVENA